MTGLGVFADCFGSEVLLDIPLLDFLRYSNTHFLTAGRLAIRSRIRDEASCLFIHTVLVAGISWAARRCSRCWLAVRAAKPMPKAPRAHVRTALATSTTPTTTLAASYNVFDQVRGEID